MKFGVLCFALLGLVVLNSGKMMAQDDPLAPQQKSVPFYIGPVAGVNVVSHSTELKTVAPTGTAICPTLTNGSSIGYYAGISMEYFLGGAANSTQSIIGKVVYSTMPSNFEKRGDSYPSLVNDNTVFSTVDFTAEAIVNLVVVEALYKLNLFESTFGVTAGVNLDYILTAEENTKMKLVTDDPNIRFNPSEGTKYEDNFRTIILKEGEIAGKGTMRFALKFGLQYEINGGKGIVIVPNVNYNLGLNSITSEKDWKVSAFQAGVDVRFALGGN